MSNRMREWIGSMTFPISHKKSVLYYVDKLNGDIGLRQKADYTNSLLCLSLEGDANRFRVNFNNTKEA